MNPDFSLIDANLARASEGIRVVEDIARFVFADQKKYSKLKSLRHELKDIEYFFGSAQLVQSRREVDVGRTADQVDEYIRTSSWSIIRANCNRVTQAIRVLEEFAKLYGSLIALDLENIRYQLYTIEYNLLVQTPHFWLQKYFFNGVVYPLSSEVNELIWLIDHGAKVIQLRDKVSPTEVVFQKAEYLCDYIANKNSRLKDPILFIINDYIEIAAELPVAGVHIGQDVIDVKSVRQKIGSNKIIGRSNNSLSDVRSSVEAGADYVSIGPVYPTPTKPDRTAVGLDVVRRVAEETTIPWLAIGGINRETISAVRQTGAKNFAVVSDARYFFA